MPELPLADWANNLVDWLIVNLAPAFEWIRVVVANLLQKLEVFFQNPSWVGIFLVFGLVLWLLGKRRVAVFTAGFLVVFQLVTNAIGMPWPDLVGEPLPMLIIVALMGLVGWKLAGWGVGLFSVGGLLVIESLGLWRLSMSTISLMTVAIFISLTLAIPLGIAAARSNWVERTVRPILDIMQTMPAFVYLVPALMFFGIGKVPGVMATIIFSAPPAVRLTNLGIREASYEATEAGVAFGCTPMQLLFKVQLPLAMPTIMAGVNQCIMLSLSMVVLAAMIASGGLGQEILMALGHVDPGRGFAGGLAIIIIAMILDRVTRSRRK